MDHEAIRRAYPNVVTIHAEKGCFDRDGNIIDIDDVLVTQAKDLLDIESAKNAYKVQRASEYPDIGDQLDAIIKEMNYRRLNGENLTQDMDSIVNSCLEVKSKYPKA